MNKRALITGASEGLGRCFAKQLARRGYNTTVVARNEGRLQSLVEELEQELGKHDYIVADLSAEEGVQRCAKRLEESSYDLLINNAGYSQFGDFTEADLVEEHKILAVNCQTLMTLSHVFLRNARKGDALINLSSLTNYLPTPVQPTYVATKCFNASFSESLWFQQRPRGVYVQGLCPGVTRTQFMERASDISGWKKTFLDMIAQTPEQVVATSIRALEKRQKPIVIPGLSNRLLAGLLKLTPRKPLVWVSGKLGEFGLS